MAEFIKRNDSLNEGREKINKSIQDAEDAKVTAQDADQKADQALSNSEDTQNQLDQVVIEGDSSVEAAQARIDAKGNSHETLKQRLDNDYNQTHQKIDSNHDEVTSQLAQTMQDRLLAVNFTKYGKIKFPTDFTKNLPFELFLDRNGNITHDFNFSTLSYENKVYVDSINGLETNDGLTENTPVDYLSKAFEIANGLSGDVEIVILSKLFSTQKIQYRVNSHLIPLEKNITISSAHEDGSYIFTGADSDSYTWTPTEGVYRVGRSAVEQVIDYKFKDVLGHPKVYKEVGSVTECAESKGSWYTNGTTTWVNRIDGSAPDNELGLLLTYTVDITFDASNYTLTFNNVHFWMQNRDSDRLSACYVKGNQSSRFFANKSSFRFATMNGFDMDDVGECYLFNSYASHVGYDGFNYHGSGDEFVFEYNCYSHDNGWIIGYSGNATTAHDGMTILRVGCVGHDTQGPVLADVNGCYSLNYDCTMYNSLREYASNKAAFYFDDVNATVPGKAYLFDCGGGGEDTFSINSDGADITVRNFKGNQIPSSLPLTVLTE